ncbi:Protein sof1 [Tilletia horrida]|uniref:DDB1- and CUL4-associated factor 13 n=1 Tax=Tilletia horrida TaxID=155126 RepID=A0AAN6G542_9BASI|nr:Protein sof1 [Tilletia horrida]KAK0529792.1 Protein sof1 [Tilletia horrida]KAK0538679.1 Protein sof1 [Tilletia horrida]KAK0551605.1 Protein sof1 [Tilletia horrida]
MKINVLSRSLDAHTPARLGDLAPTSRNLDPALHPFSKPREYTRALNAAKLNRLFAKPFVASLGDGHIDGVYALATDPLRLSALASGSGDGEVRLWDLTQQRLVHAFPGAHSGIIQSLAFCPLPAAGPQGGRVLLSCSTDATIKVWNADPHPERTGWGGAGEDMESDGEDGKEEEEDGEDGFGEMTAGGDARRGGLLSMQQAERSISEPLSIYTGRTAFNCLTPHAALPHFASASTSIQIWDLNRAGSSGTGSEALQTFHWANDGEAINVVRFNQSEREVLASTGSDRSVVLYDTRGGKPLSKMVMRMRANDLAWSPMEPTTFAVGSEDHNIYTFDMRNLKSATQIYKDHVAAVMSVSYSPTGQELVSGAYDRTLRLWTLGQGAHSRDVYHTKRMQRIFATAFTLDARFVLSGSDDGNVRLWKARASEKLGILNGREKAALEYQETLRRKWAGTADVKRIEKQRNVPKQIKQAQALKRTMLESQRRKEEHRRRHTKKGNSKPQAARKEAILAIKE